MMSCHLRSVSLVDELVCGLDLRTRDTCTFLTFGKSSSSSSTPRPAVVAPEEDLASADETTKEKERRGVVVRGVRLAQDRFSGGVGR